MQAAVNASRGRYHETLILRRPFGGRPLSSALPRRHKPNGRPTGRSASWSASAPAAAPISSPASSRQPLSEMLHQSVVVENKVGAGGTIAAEQVARADKDGYTALMTSPAHTVSAVMLKSIRYDAVKDFAPVSWVANSCLRHRRAQEFSRRTTSRAWSRWPRPRPASSILPTSASARRRTLPANCCAR